MANKLTVALTRDQYEHLIELMHRGSCEFRPNDRIAAALVLEANLGLRIEDILQLRMSDIVRDGERYRLNLIEQKTQKKRTFTVPLPIYTYIERYCKDNSIVQDDVIFPITERNVQKYLAKVVDYAGYKNIGTHSFRKFFATQIYIDNNYNIVLVQQLLQHSSAATTQRYIGITSKEMESALLNHIDLL